MAGLCPPAGEEGPKSVSNLAGVNEISGSRPEQDILAQGPNVTRHETVSWASYQDEKLTPLQLDKMARYILLGLLLILSTCIEDINTAVGHQ